MGPPVLAGDSDRDRRVDVDASSAWSETMTYYRDRNRYCPCQRCRMRSAMGPAVLITLGVLFLLDNIVGSHTFHYSFHYTWPVLLIVIGVVKVLGYNASAEGHVPRGYFVPGPGMQAPPPPPPPGAPQPPSS